MTWARHEAATKYCAIREVVNGSWITMCRGRWSSSDLYEIHDRPEADDRCVACERERQ